MVKEPGGVIVFSEVRGDTRRYRSLHLVEQLRLAGIPCEFVHLADTDRVQQAITLPWKMAIFHRVAFGNHVAQYLKVFRASNTAVLSDFDDLIFDLSAFAFIDSPDFVDPLRARLYRQNMQNIQTMLMLSDAVLASTDFLANRIRQIGKPVWVHRNAFSMEMFMHSEMARKQNHQPLDQRVIIGYASGTLTHNRDFNLIKPALMEVMGRYPQVELHLVGSLDSGEGWGMLEKRIRQDRLVPWRDLPSVLANFDINLAPLVADNPFAQSKSEIKYMEAALVETPTIASPTDAFQYAINHGKNGFLADGVDDWITALSALITDRQLRTEIGRCAYTEVVKSYHPSFRAVQLIETLNQISHLKWGEPLCVTGYPDQNEIASRAESLSSGKNWLPASYEKDPSNLRLGIYSLKSRGLKTLLGQVWIYFRRLIAPIIPFRRSS